jgi:ribonucleoside-triphosphate reductase
VVGLYLERTHRERIPSVLDVEDAVERVLIDTGHAKTAKAFILHRDRRFAAKETVRVEDDDDAGERPLPLVGSDAGAGPSRWSKARVVSALVAEAGLETRAAEEIARAVESRVLGSGRPRVTTSLVRALVDAELFARGHARPLERQRIVGLPKHDLARRLAEGLADRRGSDPAAFAEALGEEVLAPYVLEEVVPAAAAEAHRVGDLHLYDLGALHPACALAPAAAPLVEARLRGEGVARSGGVRRFGGALADATAAVAARASRVVAIEDVNVLLAPFVRPLDEDALSGELRELLLSPAVLSFARRGGLRTLEWTLAAEVPERLRRRPVPAPAPPGCCYGDFEDASLATARALLEVAGALQREGMADRLPALTLVVSRGAVRDPAGRALVRAALAVAAGSGEPRIAIDPGAGGSRGTRWLRVRADESDDPWHAGGGDVVVATAGALNLAAAALRAGAERTEEFFAECDRLLGLLLDAARATSEFRRGRGATPEATWFGPAAGAGPDEEGSPTVEPGAPFHVVEPVGADRAAAVLRPSASSEERRALRTHVVRYVQSRAAAEGERRGLATAVVEAPVPEACERLARLDTARFASVSAWWGGDTPTYAAVRSGAGVRREPAHPGRGRSAESFERVRRRVDTDRPPPIEDLFAGFEGASSDPRVVEYALDPWPRRFVRRPP